MGSAISKGADGLGSVIGNALSAPFKSIFGGSCEDICSGSWDVTCFIDHFCVSNLIKLVMILALCYIFLLFIYLLFKVGICQCIGRSLCKMCCVTCELCWFAFENITTNLWHRLINTKRVYRGRRCHFRDVELGYISTDDDESSNGSCDYSQVGRKRNSLREIRRNNHNYRFARPKGRSWRMRSSRQVQFSKARNRHGKARIFKRRRIK